MRSPHGILQLRYLKRRLWALRKSKIVREPIGSRTPTADRGLKPAISTIFVPTKSEDGNGFLARRTGLSLFICRRGIFKSVISQGSSGRDWTVPRAKVLLRAIALLLGWRMVSRIRRLPPCATRLPKSLPR